MSWQTFSAALRASIVSRLFLSVSAYSAASCTILSISFFDRPPDDVMTMSWLLPVPLSRAPTCSQWQCQIRERGMGLNTQEETTV